MKSVAIITLLLSMTGSALADEVRRPLARISRAPIVLTASQLDRVTAGTTFQFNPETLTTTKSVYEESGDSAIADDSSTWLRMEQTNSGGGM